MAFEFSLSCVYTKGVSMVLGTGQCGLDTATVKPLAVSRASSPIMNGSYPPKGLQPDTCYYNLGTQGHSSISHPYKRMRP